MEYLFNNTVNLKEDTIYLPPKSVLNFNGGCICNGTLIGDSTSIVGKRDSIFNKIKIKGSWIVQDISTDMFCDCDSNILSNISNLSSDKLFNRIVINKDCRVPVKSWSSYFIIKSNTEVILNADIYSFPTEHKGGYCIMISGKDICIKGNNHYLFGSLANPTQKECSEWLHGVCIDKSSSYITVYDLNSWLFCGDGFYNQGSDIIFKKINAKFNGRQGLSITNGKNIIIKNSQFTNTGYYRIASGGGPGAGIDIEPNNESSVDNILIKDCKVIDNHRYIDGHINDIEIYGSLSGRIDIKNCTFSGLYLGDCQDIAINNCASLETVYYINNRIGTVRLNVSVKPLIFYNEKK